MQANRGDFHCLGDAAVRRYDPRLMEHIEGYTESHPWSSKSVGKKTFTKYKFQLATTVQIKHQLFVRISYPKMDPLLSLSMGPPV